LRSSVRILDDVLRQARLRRSKFVVKHVGVAEYRCEEVVERVGDARRKKRNAFHLLRLRQLLFALFAFGNVLPRRDRADHTVASIIDRRRGGEHRDGPAIVARQNHFTRAHHFTGERRSYQGHFLTGELRGSIGVIRSTGDLRRA
jgi:hypothetical protein